ncbi:MAG: hypothetical protein ACKVU0_02820 [Saprospiraceae bacterium]
MILETDPGDRMPPPPKSALPQAQIDLFKKWLAQGAQKNACDENFGGCNLDDAKFGTFIQPLNRPNVKVATVATPRKVALNLLPTSKSKRWR